MATPPTKNGTTKPPTRRRSPVKAPAKRAAPPVRKSDAAAKPAMPVATAVEDNAPSAPASSKAAPASGAKTRARKDTAAKAPAAEAPAKTRVTKAAAKTTKAPAKPKTKAASRSNTVLAVPRQKARAAVAALPEVTPKQAAVAAAATGGVLAAVGAAFFLWRASKADQPDYRLIERDGDFEIREYPALVTAATDTHGQRHAALDRGFDILAGYIFAKSRPGEKIAMTAPVLSDGSNTTRWRTRFVMPKGKARGDLPTAPPNVTLESEPPRRAAAVRFSGRADDALLAAKEGALRSWLQLKDLPHEGKAEHAFYNSPMMPGPLRRNEVIVTLSTS